MDTVTLYRIDNRRLTEGGLFVSDGDHIDRLRDNLRAAELIPALAEADSRGIPEASPV
jgi:hypothetical protein